MKFRGSVAAVTVSALCLLPISACSGEGPTPSPTQSTELSPAQKLAAAKAKIDAAPAVRMRLTSANVPQRANGIVSADGVGAHPPAFKGTFKVSLNGIQADAEIISLDGEVYAKLPLIPGMNKIDPKTFGLPDPALLFSPDRGLTTLLTAATSPTAGADVRRGAEVLETITGQIPGTAVVDLFLVGDRKGTFAATFALTDTQELREVSLVGPFFGTGSSSTYTLTLDEYGKPVTITKP